MTHKDGLSEEALLAILAGCEGVTPGPYSINHGSENHHHCRLFDGEGREVLRTEWDKGLNAHRNVAHFARLDPDTVRSLVTELLERRRTPANEPVAWAEAHSFRQFTSHETNYQAVHLYKQDSALPAIEGRRVPLYVSPSSPVAPEEVTDMVRPTFDQVRDAALKAVKALDDWTNLNETEWTGWGDGHVPPGATWWRVKSGQALKALAELAPKENTHAE